MSSMLPGVPAPDRLGTLGLAAFERYSNSPIQEGFHVRFNAGLECSLSSEQVEPTRVAGRI